MTAPGRLAAAPRGGTEPDRGTRIGLGPLSLHRPPGRLQRPVPVGDGTHAPCFSRSAVGN